MFGTFEDSLDALFSQDTNEEKRRKKELEEKQSRELQRALELEEHETKMRKFQTDYLTKSSQREEQLRALPNAKTREKTEYSDFIKSHYGFTPDNKKKKVLAGILEGVGGIASSLIPGLSLTGYGQGRVQARNRAEKDYKSDYDKLLGVERLEAQQYRDQGKLQQDAINASLKGGMAYNAQDIMREKSALQDKTANRKLDITKALGEAKQKTTDFLAYFQAKKAEAEAGSLEAKTEYQELKNGFAKKMGMPVENLNDNMIAMHLSKMEDDDAKEEYLKNLGIIKEKGKAAKTQNPRLIQNKESYVEDGVVKERNNFQWVYPPGTGGGKSQGQVSSHGQDNPLAKAITTPGSRLQKDSKTGSYFPEEMTAEEAYNATKGKLPPQVDFGKDTAAAKKYAQDKRGWVDLNQRSRIVNDQAFDGLATGQMNWRDPVLKNKVVEAYRAATGRVSATEATVEQNDIINLMEHIRRRFSGRPAYALFEQIKKSMGGDWDNQETFAKKAGGMHLLIELGRAVAENDSLVDVLDKIAKETANNPARKSFGVAYAEEIEDAVNRAKNKKERNVVPSIEGAIRRALKKAKTYEEAYGPKE